MQLVLASSSKARAAILSKLKLPFTTIHPDIDESLLPSEKPEAHVYRLAETKALAAAKKCSEPVLIIACDSVCVLDGKILSKPETFENAKIQLEHASNNTISFYTGLCLFNSQTKKFHTLVDEILVTFRKLDEQTIENYLKLDQPFECAGSIRAEGLGIALIKKIQVDDANSLVGLPLIKLIDLLTEEGVQVLA